MRLFIILITLTISGCALYDQYAQDRIEEKARIEKEYEAQSEEMEKKNQIEREQQANYIASKAVVECLKSGFKKNTPEFNQCTYVSITDAVNEINNKKNILALQEKQQEENRKQQFFQNYLGAMAVYKQNNISCTRYGNTTNCY